ncbi:MAG TPA: protein translocase subunit SecD [Sandaracinaceae bacterium LLY-WYZ-13_1]|nr:protein translocase subunit SecD [Sandaracinaceae bacterium LLY-WYZ-13_1]
MDRGWYFRLSLVLAAVLGAFVALWPTFSRLGWLGAPAWVTDAVDARITPGLDIQGGLRLMYTVDMDAAIEDRMQARAQQLLRSLGEKLDIVEEGDAPDEDELQEIRDRVSARIGTAESRVIRLDFESAQDAEAADHDLIESFGDLREDARTETSVTLVLRDESIDTLREVAVNQAQETIKNRIAELGISEANVRARDIDIIVEVPGATEEEFDEIREIISQTARLEFKIVDDGNPWVQELRADLPEGITVRPESGVSAGEERPSVTSYNLYAEGWGACPEGVEPLEGAEENDDGEPQCTARQRLGHFIESVEDRVPEGRMLALGRVGRRLLDDEEGEGESAAPDEWRSYLLYETPPDGSDPVGGEHLEDAAVTTDPGPPPQPVVSFTMTSQGARLMQDMTGGNLKRRMAVVLDDEVSSAPVIQSTIGARGQITLGGMLDVNQAYEEANDLVIVLRAGALPAPIIPQNEQLIGPTLGRDSVQQGALGALIGISLVLIFMGVYYQVAGLVADVMVILNVLFLFGIMAFFNNDLTLPGIAGIALTVGMAVDANVLITERMREELRMGKSARAAVDQGFRRAFWSIFDSQLTTFIAGVVLFQYGSPEIQGFAKTLMIGIVTSLFTGVFCSKVLFDWLVKGLKVRRLRVG